MTRKLIIGALAGLIMASVGLATAGNASAANFRFGGGGVGLVHINLQDRGH